MRLKYFFVSFSYQSLGEPIEKAVSSPLGSVHDDLSLAAACVHGWQNRGDHKYFLGGDSEVFRDGPRRPILFENKAIRSSRHAHLTKLILSDERKFGAVNASCSSTNCKVD